MWNKKYLKFILAQIKFKLFESKKKMPSINEKETPEVEMTVVAKPIEVTFSQELDDEIDNFDWEAHERIDLDRIGKRSTVE